MEHRSIESRSVVRRFFLLAASLTVGALVWYMLGEPEAATAAESGKALARIDGAAITESMIHDRIAGELDELERRREALVAGALRAELERRLIVAEAARRGISVGQLLSAEIDDRLPAGAAGDERRRRALYRDLIARLESSHEVEVLVPAGTS